jgi:two-component system OmpR family sensor kinase
VTHPGRGRRVWWPPVSSQARSRFGSVRWRSTLAAAVVTAVALAGTAFLLVVALQEGATGTVMAQAQERAAEVASQVHSQGTAQLTQQLVGATDRSTEVQVVGPDGTVVAGTEGVGGPPLSAARPGPGQQVQNRDVMLPGESDAAVIAARGTSSGGANYVALVAVGLGTVRETVGAATTVLAVGLPLLLVVVTMTVYALVGRALRPVEAIRAEVAEIEQADLTRRVPEPGVPDEIGRLARTMNAMLTRLEVSQRAQRRFVADASHELRSPLATLRAHLDVAHADAGQLDEAAREAMEKELGRLGGLVDDMLLLARADERGLGRVRGEVDLDDVMDEERGRLRRTTTLRVTASLAPVKIRGDRSELTRMVRNLVDNASRFATSTVHLGLRVVGSAAVIEIADDGPGIPPADRERVLRRFVRLDDSRSVGGTGLGLAIVAEIASAHGGTLRVGEREGGGALVRVEIPNAVGGNWSEPD